MANQFRVKINGQVVPLVKSVTMGLEVAGADDGHPQDARPRLHVIRISRESDKSTDLWNWATTPYGEQYRKGSVEFLDPEKEDKVLKTVNWEDGFVRSYQEAMPHTQHAREQPVVEMVEISARVIDFDGAKIEAWRK